MMLTQNNPQNLGEFYLKKIQYIDNADLYYQGKVIVLVNEYVQSSGETFAMAIRACDNTLVLGSQTSGANGNVFEITLPGGIKTNVSGLGVYYPDGSETQRIGIIPDIEVKPTIKGIKEGRDELIEKAVEIINKEKLCLKKN